MAISMAVKRFSPLTLVTLLEKAEKEFQIYRQREMAQLESDFDRMMKQLPKK